MASLKTTLRHWLNDTKARVQDLVCLIKPLACSISEGLVQDGTRSGNAESVDATVFDDYHSISADQEITFLGEIHIHT